MPLCERFLSALVMVDQDVSSVFLMRLLFFLTRARLGTSWGIKQIPDTPASQRASNGLDHSVGPSNFAAHLLQARLNTLIVRQAPAEARHVPSAIRAQGPAADTVAMARALLSRFSAQRPPPEMGLLVAGYDANLPVQVVSATSAGTQKLK